MSDEPGLIRKSEKEFDDLKSLWKRRKWLCVLVVLSLLATPGWVITKNLWGNGKLKEELESAKLHIKEVEGERDRYADRLAPFWARADELYASEPKDKRLSLLLTKLEEKVTTLEGRIPQPRSISGAAAERILSSFSRVPPIKLRTIEVRTSSLGDRESLRVSDQIRDLVRKAGIKDGGHSFIVIGGDPNTQGIQFTSKHPPNGPIRDGFVKLSFELKCQQPPVWILNSNYPENLINIEIGSP